MSASAIIDSQARAEDSNLPRNDSFSSTSSLTAASDTENTAVYELNAAGEKKQTAQARDWRPKATLHMRKPTQFWDYILKLALMDDDYHEMRPNAKRGPIPSYPLWKAHAFVLPRALAVPVLQYLSYTYFPKYKWPTGLAYFIHVLALTRFARQTVNKCNGWAREYGTLDEKNIGRDRIPDKDIPRLGFAFISFMITRTAGEFILKYNRRAGPLSGFSWRTPFKMGLWFVVMDYFFYCYHRLSHETSLWKIHAHHHTTRHPSPALAILADNIQEVIEIALVPLCATLLVPMSYNELLVTIYYCAYTEIIGHAGIRCIMGQPIVGPLLRLLGCELIIEDHDLHHRYGKSGRNYGKQTRIWDRLFGTTTPREEMANVPGYTAL